MQSPCTPLKGELVQKTGLEPARSIWKTDMLAINITPALVIFYLVLFATATIAAAFAITHTEPPYYKLVPSKGFEPLLLWS